MCTQISIRIKEIIDEIEETKEINTEKGILLEISEPRREKKYQTFQKPYSRNVRPNMKKNKKTAGKEE